MEEKREVELVVISDVHLGTAGCHASELLHYLRSIHPQTLILNGDIIDIWQFRKRFFPKPHLKVIKHLLGLASNHTRVYYITGNHDELFRKFNGMKIGKLQVVNDLKMNLGGKKAWFFHGDVFDVVVQNSRWLAIVGAMGYDTLIWLNTRLNRLNRLLGFEPVSFSKKVKQSVKRAVTYINSFEESAAQLAAKKGFDMLVCGHIHQPEYRCIQAGNKNIAYLNAGDWVENLTSLEYHHGNWTIFSYHVAFPDKEKNTTQEPEQLIDSEPKQLLKRLLLEFQN